jgi:phosphoribosylaminoimidazole (AIR) synthetase
MIDALAGAVKAINHALGGDPIKNKRRIEAKTMAEEIKRANQLIRSAFKAIGQ